ncbi:MAG: FixH family protein [Lysobacterales bacterium]
MNKPTDMQETKPWYRHFWVWFIIALPAAAVAAGLFTLWLAVSNPDSLVISADEYQQLRSSLKAESSQQGAAETDSQND